MDTAAVVDKLVEQVEQQSKTIGMLRRELVGTAADLECRRHAAQGPDPLAVRLRRLAEELIQ